VTCAQPLHFCAGRIHVNEADAKALHNELSRLLKAGRVLRAQSNEVYAIAPCFTIRRIDEATGDEKIRFVQSHLQSNDITLGSALPMANPAMVGHASPPSSRPTLSASSDSAGMTRVSTFFKYMTGILRYADATRMVG
jgi:hypothetical protein